MIRLGITGGIGSGKSVVSNLLRVKNIPVYDTDTAAKEIMQTNAKVREALSLLLGNDIYANGVLDRKKMASIIFQKPDLLQQTNRIVHPAVVADFLAWGERQRVEIIGCESALLTDVPSLRGIIHHIILVTAPVEVRIQRCMQRDNAPQEAIMARINNQNSEQKMRELSDFIVENDGQKALIPQIENILRQIRSL